MKKLITVITMLFSFIDIQATNENHLKNINDTTPKIIIQCGGGGGKVNLKFKPDDILIQTLSMSIDQSVIESIEFAIKEKGYKDIIVIGDTLAFDLFKSSNGFEEKNTINTSLSMMDFVDSIKKRYKPRTHPNIQTIELNQQNVDGVAKDIISKSTFIADLYRNHALKIHKELSASDKNITWN